MKCQQFQVSSQSDTAYLKLRESILSAAVLPGEHLVETDWAERLGLGRFAIREGLKRLHGESLVTLQRGRYRVFVPSSADIREITHLRMVLEIGALRSLSAKPSAKILAPIRKAAKDHASLVKKGYFAGAREADLEFHRSLVAAPGNGRLLKLYESSNLPLLQVTISHPPTPLDDFDLAATEHLAIVAALEKGEIVRAADELEAHLKRGEHAVTQSNP